MRIRDRQTLDAAGGGVAGERSTPAVAQALSFQAKLSNVMALGLMLALAAALLLWYYAHALTRSAHPGQTSQLGGLTRAQSEVALPPLGHIELPRFQTVHASASPTPSTSPQQGFRLTGEALLGAESPALQAAPTPPIVLAPSRQNGTGSAASSSTTMMSALERRLSGDTFVSASDASVTAASTPVATPALAGVQTWPEAVAARSVPEGAAAAPAAPPSAAGAGASPGLSSLLQDPGGSAVSARVLPGLSLLLPKGSFIDCTLETAIDSSLPGLATCVTATDTFGADGGVVLLERGTKLVGETQGQVQQGVGRVFVLWTEARTPTGVIVPLDSPGADELGRSGLPGQVERHFWQRFGAAILISVIDGGVQAGVQASTSRGGTIIYNPGGAQDVMSEILKSTVAIPPTVTKRNGDRIQVLVARDVDFSQVYELRDVRGQRR